MRSAIGRGDIDGASFRFEVGDEAWDADIRTVQSVKALHDVTLATYPAYPAASVELRSKPTREEPKMDEAATSSEGGVEAAIDEKPEAEQRTGTLRVTERDQGNAESRTLLGKYIAAGWAPGGGRTELAWQDFETASESRALTWTGSVDLVNQRFGVAAPSGSRRSRWLWRRRSAPAGTQATRNAGRSRTARTLLSGGTAIRAIDATGNKPEIASTVTSAGTAVKQVAAVVSGVPNIMLQQNNIESVIGQDLRLTYSDGLDFLVTSGLATAGTQTLASDPLLNVIRRTVSVLWAAGYNPDTLILTPANSETIDLLQSGGTAGYPGGYVFGAGQFGPPRIFGMNVRISKNIANPTVVDSNAFGKLYASPVSLASFEENAGKTNTSLVRFEGNAAFGIERLTAAVRIT